MDVTLSLLQIVAIIIGSALFAIGGVFWLVTNIVNQRSPGTTSLLAVILLLSCFWIPAIAIPAMAFTG